jgi:hypothetical protein
VVDPFLQDEIGEEQLEDSLGDSQKAEDNGVRVFERETGKLIGKLSRQKVKREDQR